MGPDKNGSWICQVRNQTLKPNRRHKNEVQIILVAWYCGSMNAESALTMAKVDAEMGVGALLLAIRADIQEIKKSDLDAKKTLVIEN